MAKFTVFFNDSPIQTHNFDEGVVRIGRDETNDIHIDSLSIAPAHAVAIFKEEKWVIKCLNDSFPLFVNEEKTKAHIIKDGDKIGIGKHVIVYNSYRIEATEPEDEVNGASDFNLKIPPKMENEAYLQVTAGKHIGRLITLRKVMTKIGQSGFGIIIISRRKEGYFISALEGHDSITINDEPLGNDTIQLIADDKVELKGLVMHFYLKQA
jgi:pSer/pThr/pTyr-binding forkhead associated (FHA) protein